MVGGPLFLDPPPYSWRTRKIEVRPSRWYVVVELDRDGYVDTHGGDDGAALPAEFVAAAERLQSASIDRIWLDGYAGGFTYGAGNRSVTLFVQYPHVDEAVEALLAAEVEGDTSKLDALALRLALPVDDWLAPGERLLRRGVDFDTRPSAFLRLLRAKAHHQGLRLNGRATPAGVWIRPVLSAVGRLERAVRPEDFTNNPDRWTNAKPVSGPLRPLEDRIRDVDRSQGAIPVEFRRVAAHARTDCPCGYREAFKDANMDRHDAQHRVWSIGLHWPKTLGWEGNLAIVTTQSSFVWRRLVSEIALAPKRENHYDFSSWSVTERPESSDTNRRAYLLRSGAYVIGYLVVADLNQHWRWNLDIESAPADKDTSTRPSIDLIWVAAVHRSRGVASTLIQALADDSRRPVTDLSWSTPLSQAGQRLAHRLSPQGIWVHN